MRDAANLVWKVAAVLRDGAPDSLLDTYQAEREPHVRTIVELAVGFGRIICTTDPEVAAARDAEMLAAGGAEAPAPEGSPPLAPGAGVGPGGGALSAQPRIDGQRLDDLVGPRFALVTRTPAPAGDPHAAWWSGRAAILDAAAHPALEPVLAGAEAVVVRPDRYVLAAGDLASVTETAQALLAGG